MRRVLFDARFFRRCRTGAGDSEAVSRAELVAGRMGVVHANPMPRDAKPGTQPANPS